MLKTFTPVGSGTFYNLYNVQTGPVTGDFYYTGYVESSVNTVYARTDISGNVKWVTKLTSFAPLTEKAQAIDSQERYVYSIYQRSHSSGYYLVNTADGSTTTIFQNSRFATENDIRTSMRIDSLGEHIFWNLDDSDTSTNYICRCNIASAA